MRVIAEETQVKGDEPPETFLSPTDLIDCDHPAVIDYAVGIVGDEQDEVAKAVKLYYAVRDDIRYNPYTVELTADHFRASATLERRVGFCVTKAILLAAVGRVVGLPTRMGFGDVRNHLATKHLLERLGSDLFVYHGYTEFFLDGKWVKATPAFNIQLCEKFRVLPLEFDGHEDSIFHPFDVDGRKHMEYVVDRGTHFDMPLNHLRDVFIHHYPNLYYEDAAEAPDFEAEAAAEAEAGSTASAAQ
jgi:transglutaminase-like putative cysteine protease